MVCAVNGEGVTDKILHCLDKIKEFKETILVDKAMLIELTNVLLHLANNENVIEYVVIEQTLGLIEDIMLANLFTNSDSYEIMQ